MTYQILSDDGRPMDSHAELDTSGITLHSRGGSAAKGNVTNAEYGPALRLLLRRIVSARLPFDRAWVDSLDVQRLPREQRIILSTRKRGIGYARISTVQQDLTRRLQAFKGEGCAKVFSDTALAELGAGDELVIAEWDRATRSMWDGLHIIEAVIDAGATIRVLDRIYIDLATPTGRGLMVTFPPSPRTSVAGSSSAPDEGRKIWQARGVKWAARKAERIAEGRSAEAAGRWGDSQ